MKLLFAFLFSLGTVLRIVAQAPPASTTAVNMDSSRTKVIKPVPVKSTDPAGAMLKTNDIANNLAQAQKLSKFYNLVQAAGLTETFKSKGPITIFVPDNNAFAKLSPGKMDSLMNPAFKLQLIALISYHAIAGRFTSKDIAHQINIKTNSATFTTLTGDTITAKIDTNRNIVLTDENGRQSTVTRFDVEQSNGMVFIINSVLIPQKRLL